MTRTQDLFMKQPPQGGPERTPTPETQEFVSQHSNQRFGIGGFVY
jgi:hypothetical protein